MKQVNVTVKVSLVLHLGNEVATRDVMADLDYNFVSCTEGATIVDTEIQDWEVGHVEWLPPGTKEKPMSYIGEVIADSSGKWTANALRFETEHEAADYARELASRWSAVRETRTHLSDDPVTHRWDDQLKRAVKIEEALLKHGDKSDT